MKQESESKDLDIQKLPHSRVDNRFSENLLSTREHPQAGRRKGVTGKSGSVK